MKKIIRIIASFVLLISLSVATESFVAPVPIPAPEETIYQILHGDDYMVAVYQIIHDGYGWFNEGPYFPTSNSQNYYSQWMISYSTATYARVWEWDNGSDEWEFIGDIHMNTSNTDIGAPGKVQRFTIDVSTIEVPD